MKKVQNNKISVIIPFRDREIKRLFHLYDSFDADNIIEFIVVDYGSKVPLKLNKISKNRPKFKVIRSDCPVWNKAHALNIGIKKALGEFIMTVDVDIVLVDKLDIVPQKECFYYSSNVRRIDEKDLKNEFPFGWNNSKPWYPDINYSSEVFGLATGGLQIYPKEWIEAWNGIDENLVYMGGMDNITIMMAKKSNKMVIQLPNALLHIEHAKKKENNFEGNGEADLALYIQSQKRHYLNSWATEPVINKFYGCKNPCSPMLKVWTENFNKKPTYKIDRTKRIMICVINNQHTLPTIFVKSLINLFNHTVSVYPNTELKFVKAAEISNMRNIAVKKSIEEGFDYLICLDTDHLLMQDTVIRLMRHNKDFVTVPTKQRITPFTPTQFYKFMTPIKQKGNYVYATGKSNLTECEVSGPVCMLMKVECLKKLKYPYYQMGYNEKPVMSSDFMFCKQLKKKGYKIFMDNSIDCPHMTVGLVGSIGKDTDINFDTGAF